VVFETIFERPSLDISDSSLKSLIYIHVSVDKVLVLFTNTTIYVLSNYLDVVEIENRNFDIFNNFYYETCIKTKDYHCSNTLDSSKHLSSCHRFIT
jgi:hypothetical protein